MAERLNVNPTRMEMQRQKARLKTAQRGWKLLKDKCDEMIRAFMELARENKRLRESLDGEVVSALRLFLSARTQMTPKEIEAAVRAASGRSATAGGQNDTTSNEDSALTRSDSPAETAGIEIETGTTSIMGLAVPKLDLVHAGNAADFKTLIKTTSTFDKSVATLARLLGDLVQLAQIEKSCDMLASEIIRLRRRINALEFILMPQIRATIRFIAMKLAENERSQLVRVMKVKEMMEKAEAAG